MNDFIKPITEMAFNYLDTYSNILKMHNENYFFTSTLNSLLSSSLSYKKLKILVEKKLSQLLFDKA